MVMCECCQGYATLCRFLTNIWLIVAIVFSALAAASCQFLEVGNKTFGLYSQGNNGECSDVGYDDTWFGWLHTWAAICGILAPVLGTIVFLLMLLDCCCKVCCSNLIQTILLTGAEMSQGFTFLLFASNTCATNGLWLGCSMGKGSHYSIIAFICYFLGGCWLCLSPKPDPLFCKKDDDAMEKPEPAPAAATPEPVPAAATPDVEAPAAAAAEEEAKPSAQVY